MNGKTMKAILILMLLLAVAPVIAPAALGESLSSSSVEALPGDPGEADAVSARDAIQPAPGDGRLGAPHVIVYYFHGTMRCQTCLDIESWSASALEAIFRAELETGTIEWYPMDIDEPANEHFWNDFELSCNSLVVVRMKNGERTAWKNLERIWDLAEDREALEQYVQREVGAILETE